MNKDEELEHLRQENQALHIANQTLREGLREAIHAMESLQKQVKDLEGVISAHQERIKTLEGQLAKEGSAYRKVKIVR
jgi:transposase